MSPHIRRLAPRAVLLASLVLACASAPAAEEPKAG